MKLLQLTDRDAQNKLGISMVVTYTVDAGYKNTGYKNPCSIYRIICILFH